MTTELTATREELRRKFFALRNFGDLAELLDVSKEKLYYYAFVADLKEHYKSFEVKKKSGGTRQISAPASPLKIIQRKLNQVLQAVYTPKASVHGFIYERNILTNAKRHLEGKTRTRHRYVFNLDLKDFFPTITQTRVEGLLKAKPYELPERVARVIARLCCYESRLPQGAPTSPIISNMICAKMDTELRRLAQEHRCTYTRYADDITFSTSLPSLPTAITQVNVTTGQLRIGDALQSIIMNNGFEINAKKVRLQTKYRRQEVTGLTINEFPNVQRKYVRQIRAMLHAWEKYGLENAQSEFVEKYYQGDLKKAPSFAQVVRGKIEYLRMIRGSDNTIYLHFIDILARLDPNFKYLDKGNLSVHQVSIFAATEGRSDWKHLKAALERFQANGEYVDLDIEFWEYEQEPPMNDGELLKMCKYRPQTHLDKTHIYIFDRDKPETVKEVHTRGREYRNWGNNVYSFAIPVPSHRLNSPDVCIELYYRDEDVTRSDKDERRLFLSNEFDKKSGRHLIKDWNCTDLNKIRRQLTVIDDAVYDRENKNIALPKNDFAQYILDREARFRDVDFSAFRLIFDMVRKIVRENARTPETAEP